jgi:hypothetical protein
LVDVVEGGVGVDGDLLGDAVGVVGFMLPGFDVGDDEADAGDLDEAVKRPCGLQLVADDEQFGGFHAQSACGFAVGDEV